MNTFMTLLCVCGTLLTTMWVIYDMLTPNVWACELEEPIETATTPWVTTVYPAHYTPRCTYKPYRGLHRGRTYVEDTTYICITPPTRRMRAPPTYG